MQKEQVLRRFGYGWQCLGMGGRLLQAKYYAESPAENPTGPAKIQVNHLRVIRGGSFQDDLLSLRIPNRGYEVGPDPSAVAN